MFTQLYHSFISYWSMTLLLICENRKICVFYNVSILRMIFVSLAILLVFLKNILKSDPFRIGPWLEVPISKKCWQTSWNRIETKVKGNWHRRILTLPSWLCFLRAQSFNSLDAWSRHDEKVSSFRRCLKWNISLKELLHWFGS